MKTFFLALSVLLNVTLFGTVLYISLEGCAEAPNGRLGVLSRDLEVGVFNGTRQLFTLPKGLVVRKASAAGAGWFEPYRFRLVVTSDDPSLVDYFKGGDTSTQRHGEYYSADIARHRQQEHQGETTGAENEARPTP